MSSVEDTRFGSREGSDFGVLYRRHSEARFCDLVNLCGASLPESTHPCRIVAGTGDGHGRREGDGTREAVSALDEHEATLLAEVVEEMRATRARTEADRLAKLREMSDVEAVEAAIKAWEVELVDDTKVLAEDDQDYVTLRRYDLNDLRRAA